MGENSKIEWCDHTFNPWVGCTKVSPACDHCYAEGWAKRAGQPELWSGERRRTSANTWVGPFKWNRKAADEGRRARVFCASLADVFDNQAPEGWRHDLWRLIEKTPHLDWLLLTKRPQNIRKMLPNFPGTKPWGDGWDNVWLGTTAENQPEAVRRITHLLNVPARVHFLSCEPLLGPLDLSGLWEQCPVHDFHSGFCIGPCPHRQKIAWVICGGESGPGARPMHPDWAKSLRDQCADAGVPFLFKQWGDWAPPDVMTEDGNAQLRFPRKAVGRPELIHVFPDRTNMGRIGKKAAGRLLDYREHNDIPRLQP